MINLFRKIRQGSLTQNKFGKYLIYAIGEIILVVIGILIAVQINNWNQQREVEKTIHRIYSIVKSDLKSDIENINFVLADMDKREPTFKKVLSGSMTREDYLACSECSGIIGGFPDLAIKKRGLELLEEKSAIFDSEQDSLMQSVISFYSYFNTEIDVATEEISTDFRNNYSYWKNNMSWFIDYYNIDGQSNINEDLISYQLGVDYRNRVGSFYVLYNSIYITHLKSYKAEALEIIESIDNRIDSLD